MLAGKREKESRIRWPVSILFISIEPFECVRMRCVRTHTLIHMFIVHIMYAITAAIYYFASGMKLKLLWLSM